MANILPFLVMNELAAARFREATANAENRLEPRLIEGGPHAGKYALPERVKNDPAFDANDDAFALLTTVALDVDVAWPPSEEV